MLSKQHTNITIKLLWISAFVLIQLLVSGVMLAQEVCVCVWGGGGGGGMGKRGSLLSAAVTQNS